MKVAQTESKLIQVASIWISRGAKLLPCQPGSKYLVKGYGQHLKHIDSLDEAKRFFGQGSLYNLAVLLPDDLICLDFDNDDLFQFWESSLPVRLIKTYQEITPRGFHLFYRLSGPVNRVVTISGIEIKKLVLVYPSELQSGIQYRPVATDLEIITLGPDDWGTLVFSLLSDDQPGQPVNVEDVRTVNPVFLGSDLLSKIKAHYPILPVAGSLTRLKSSDKGAGRWFIGCCPFHDDSHPSFWVDAERGVWGCRSGCGRGDVINLFARKHNLNLYEAIKTMAAELPGQEKGKG